MENYSVAKREGYNEFQDLRSQFWSVFVQKLKDGLELAYLPRFYHCGSWRVRSTIDITRPPWHGDRKKPFVVRYLAFRAPGSQLHSQTHTETEKGLAWLDCKRLTAQALFLSPSAFLFHLSWSRLRRHFEVKGIGSSSLCVPSPVLPCPHRSLELLIWGVREVTPSNSCWNVLFYVFILCTLVIGR